MKKLLYTFCTLAACWVLPAKAQGPVKILFVGNSFTAANDLPAIVTELFNAAGKPVLTKTYAPGGISVGDVAMGTAAHMNNPAVFELIRSLDWDYMVLQDNQGRFALDSGKFPSTAASKVIEGHLKIRDSLQFYHPCAKMIWFSGWGFQDEDISMIDQITTNYRVLNDSAKDVIAPIGPAWKESILARPDFNLWSPDGAHPDITGSYLTASIIYGSITGDDVTANPFNSVINPPDADFLKNIAQKTLKDPAVRNKSNLKGLESIDLAWDGTRLKTSAAAYVQYRWYKDNKLVNTSSTPMYIPTVSGTYRLWAKDLDNNWQKSCATEVTVTTGIDELNQSDNTAFIFPNPANGQVTIKNIPAAANSISVESLTGSMLLHLHKTGAQTQLDLSALAPGMYFVRLLDQNNIQVHPVLKLSKQ